jgi:hypothetical protein
MGRFGNRDSQSDIRDAPHLELGLCCIAVVASGHPLSARWSVYDDTKAMIHCARQQVPDHLASSP